MTLCRKPVCATRALGKYRLTFMKVFVIMTITEILAGKTTAKAASGMLTAIKQRLAMRTAKKNDFVKSCPLIERKIQ